MAARRYAHVPSARRARAAFDLDSSPAGELCARLLAQSLRHGLPASKRFGKVRAAVARSDLLTRAPVAALRLLGRRTRPDVDDVVARIAGGWVELGRGAPPATLRALVLHRRTALTIFLFSEGDQPLVVAKVPGDAERLERDAAALAAAEPANVAPGFLGQVAGIFVQDALPGLAMSIEPLTAASASALCWRSEHEAVAAGLARLASATATDRRAEQLSERSDEAVSAARLPAATRRAVLAAGRDLDDLRRAVLTHGDTSPHNCLCLDGRLSGLVDWEGARLHGAPGFDLWNHAVSYLEHGLGLVAWSQGIVAQAFAAAWSSSQFFAEARRAARRCALAGGVPEGLHDQLEVAFFARRLLVRARDPDRFPTTASTAAKMLEVVCGR